MAMAMTRAMTMIMAAPEVDIATHTAYLTHAGMRIRYGLWPGGQAKGEKPLVMVLPGFTEFIEKYTPVLTRLTAAGYDTAILDWPSQGLSGRFLADPTPVHANSFDHHLACFFAVLAKVATKRRPIILFGHSMGAHLALRAASKMEGRVLGIVAISPMMLPPIRPGWLVLGLLWGLTRIPAVARRRVPWQSGNPRDYTSDNWQPSNFNPNNPLTRDPDGFAHHPNMWATQAGTKTYGPSFGWAYAAYASCLATTANRHWLSRLRLPVLAHLPGDERIVSARYQRLATQWLPQCQVAHYPKARHELLLELPAVRAQVWRTSLAFMAGLG